MMEFYSRLFQSTHPVRGGTRQNEPIYADMTISIHPPREGWDMMSPDIPMP